MTLATFKRITIEWKKSKLLFAILLFYRIGFCNAQPTSTTKLFQARTSLAGATVKNLALFGGGLSDGKSHSYQVDLFNVTSNAWSITSLSQARHSLVAASVGDLVLFAGGFASNGPSNRVDIFDSISNTWSTEILSQHRYDLAAASVGNLILFAGGRDPTNSVSNQVDLFNASSNTLSTTRPLSQARSNLAAVSIRDLVLFAGGFNNTNVPSDRVDLFNATSNKWSTASLSQPRRYLAAASVGDLVLFAGGYNDSFTGPSDRVDLFNVTSNTWSITSLSQARGWLGGARIKNLVLFVGGLGYSDAPSDKVNIFNTISNTWTTTSLSQARYAGSTVTVGNFVIFAGGSISKNKFIETDRVDIFKYCMTHDDCDDGIFCNGLELCINGFCIPSSGDPCANGAMCNNTCNETTYNCVSPLYSNCNDGIFCNGDDMCDGMGGCTIYSGDPCVDGTICNNTCNEMEHDCFSFTNTSCDDGVFCNGTDTCNGKGTCVHSGDPCKHQQACNNACNEDANSCISPIHSSCNDGIFCNGDDKCDGNGTCIHSGDPCIHGIMCNNTCQELDRNCLSPVGTPCSNNSDPCTLNDLCIGNGQCNHFPPPSDCARSAGTKSNSNSTQDKFFIIGGVVALLVIGIVIILFWYNGRRKKDGYIPLTMYNAKIFTVRLIERVIILERLGGGQFGDVYRGLMDETMPVALKKLKSSDFTEEFEKEITILCNLNHPNVVHLYGMHTSVDGEKYMVFEFMSDGNLSQLLQTKQQEVSISDLIYIARHIVNGMRYLEENQILHRDLALRNVLMTHDKDGKYIAKISDFGMSRLNGEGIYLTSNRTIPIKWSAPESLEYGLYNIKSDVWSFGISLWELFSYGKIPYAGMSNEQVMEQIPKGYRLAIPEGCPSEVYNIMQQCWKSKPSERPTFGELTRMIHSLINQYGMQQTYIVSDIDIAPLDVEEVVYN